MAKHHTIRRRTFLKITAASLLTASTSACTHKRFFNPDEDIILSGGSYIDGNTTQHALIIINLTTQEKRVIDVPFMAHDILINPNNKYHIYCFKKNGRNACEIDLQKKAIIRTFHSTEGKNFSGHAAFSKNGENLYCIENNIDNNPDKRLGNIIVRHNKTLATKKQLLTGGLSAHDCHLLNEQTLVVSNTGQSDSKHPSLVNVALDTEKISKHVQTTSDKIHHNLNYAHFEISEENDLIVASAPLLQQNNSHDNKLIIKHSGGVSIKTPDSQLITMSKPEVVIERMTGEALSIEISTHNRIAAITHPDANLLTFWSIDKKEIVKAFGIEKPRGISQTIDGKNFIVSYGNKAAMAKISVSDLTPLPDSIVQPTHTSGEHIINWSKTLRKIMPKNLYL
jgi:hypothetical protein